jgi:hypothetical protein
MVHDVPNASKRTSRTGERDDMLTASVLGGNMARIAIELMSEVGCSGIDNDITMLWL